MHSPFTGKKIVMGITGSIAAFKVAGWVSTLAKDGADVAVVMTDSACKFIAPLTFAALSGNPVPGNMFSAEQAHSISHIQLGQEAALVCIAPATANTIAKLSCGLADDLLTTTVLAATCPVMIVPAMNSQMFANPLTRQNLQRLADTGIIIVDPATGTMACKSEGPGRLPEWESVSEQMLAVLSERDLQGEKFLITAGPTREHLDPARFLSNRSSGKMGYALARSAVRRGADVVLVSGPVNLPTPFGVQQIDVQTAEEMHTAVMEQSKEATVIVKAAAVSDFRPLEQAAEKVKKEHASFELKLEQTVDILQQLGMKKNDHGYLLVGFAAESENLREAGSRKLKNKHLDLIAINDISRKNTGFESDTNQVTLLDHSGFTELPLVSKDETADLILDRIVELLHNRTTANA